MPYQHINAGHRPRKSLHSAVLGVARQGGKLICLLKPQFEGGPGKVDKRGVLRDASLRQSILESTSIWLDTCLGWHFEGSIDSPIKGGDGNIEFLLVCSKSNRFA